jgi:hypothetical protein
MERSRKSTAGPSGFSSIRAGGQEPSTQPFRSAPIPFPLRAGGAYEVLLEKALLPRGDGAETCYSFTLKDLRGSGSVSLTEPFDGDAAGWPGHCWGSPGVMARGGPITVLAFAWGTPFPRRPRLWIGGDSFVEGDSIYARKDRRFAELLYRELGGNAVITGAGGETSGQLAARLDMDLEPFAPEYCLVLIGANDRDFETWRRDLGRIISRIQGKGAVPILGTLAPRASRQAFLDRPTPGCFPAASGSWILPRLSRSPGTGRLGIPPSPAETASIPTSPAMQR